jgi:Holliday junction resolvase RusA-like endonuclease
LTIINLSPPPSTNNLYFNVKGRGRVPTSEYTAWRELAGWELKQQRPPKFAGPVSIKIEHEDTGRIDGDNTLKPLFDLLVTHEIIKGDTRKVIRSFSFDWRDDVVGVRLTVAPK